LKYLSPGDPFFVTLRLAITVGFILAFPIVVYQVWGFISPALLPRERRAIVPALYLGLVLFCAGVALAYFLVLPMTLKFFMGFQTETLEQNIVIGPYMGFVVKILLAFGIVFELPVVVMVLAALGLVTSKFLSEKRRYAIAGMAVVAAFVTPGDAVTLTIFMMGPLLLLYELSIGLAKLMERRRARALIESVAIIAILLSAAPASAQQQPDTTRPKTPREAVTRRLRDLVNAERRDTVRTDSAATPTSRPARPTGAAQESSDFPIDSVMRQLLELPGFAATRYRGSGARFFADSSMLFIFGKPDSKAGVLRDGQSMLADSLLTFDDSSNVACGYGKPVLSGGTSGPVNSNLVCYNTRERRGMALGARTQITEGANWFVVGDLYTRGGDSYSHDAKFTDCSLEVPHYHFSAKEMKVTEGDVLVGRNVTLSFGDVPVFWLPFFMQSMKSGRRSGLLMPEFSVNDIVRRNAGYNRRIKDIGFYWAVSDNLGALASLDWWSNNYTALEGSFDYTFPRQFMGGGATVRRFWREGGGKEFSVVANHRMEPNERTSITVDAQYVTSADFVEQNSVDPRELRRTIASNAGLSRRFDWGSVSMQASRNHYLTDDRKNLVLPSVGLNLATVTLFEGATWTGSGQLRRVSDDMPETELDPSGLDAGVSSSFNVGRFAWSQSFNSRANRRVLPRVPVLDTTKVLQADDEMSWSTSLSYQQNLIGTTTFTPAVTATGRSVKNFNSGFDFVNVPVRFDANATLKADIFGFWPGIGSISRIRHRFSPTISYGYSPATAIDSLRDSLRARVFGARETRERNTITIGFSQTFEGKFREDRDTSQARRDSLAVDSLTADPSKPRRSQQGRKITILSLNTDAIAYDFVEARETGRGITVDQISNTVNSDLLRGLQLSVTHDLFKEDSLIARTGREFAPHLSRINAAWSLSSNSWIFRMLGLTRKSEATPQAGSAETPVPNAAQGGPAPGPEYGIMGNRDQGRRIEQPQQQQQRGTVGAWNASFNLAIDRPREIEDTTTESGLFARRGSQMLTTNFS
ncbi:MAG TPA: twin-arginine translocase subunit TatC, partial [Longimicrobiales bacterium]